LGLQAGSELFLCVVSASGRFVGILGIFLDPFDRIQGMRAFLRGGSGGARARGPLRRSSFRSYRQRNRNTEQQDCANKMCFSHTRSFIENTFQKGGCWGGLTTQ
jgi:hypothetical protein